MSRRLKLVVLVLVIVLLISSMSILLTSCNEGEQESKDYGTFYTLQEAYDLGYIDMQDLKSIAFYVSGSYDGTSESLGEDFVPTPMNPEELSDKQWAELEEAYVEKLKTEFPDIPQSQLGLNNRFRYLGTYNNHIVVRWGQGGFPAISEFYVEGILFRFNSGPFEIYVWVI